MYAENVLGFRTEKVKKRPNFVAEKLVVYLLCHRTRGPLVVVALATTTKRRGIAKSPNLRR